MIFNIMWSRMNNLQLQLFDFKTWNDLLVGRRFFKAIELLSAFIVLNFQELQELDAMVWIMI